jgi:hypothetical protein
VQAQSLWKVVFEVPVVADKSRVAGASTRQAEVHGALFECLSRFQAAPFLFVGSELSRRYLSVPSLPDLLHHLAEATGLPVAKDPITAGRDLVSLATSVAEELHDVWRTSATYALNRTADGTHVTDSESTLKIEIARSIRDRDVTEPSEPVLRAELAALNNAVIDGIITTSWDALLERAFPDFHVYVGQDAVIRADLMGVGELYKTHGSATNPDSLVLTQRDYDQFQKRSPHFAAKVLTVFTEHPVVFLGCAPMDKDVIAILSSVAACLGTEATDRLKGRLIFIELDRKSRTKRLAATTLELPSAPSLPVLATRVVDFQGVFGALGARHRGLPAAERRRLKERVHRLVLANDPRAQLHAQGIDGARIHETDVVFGVGTIAQLRTTRHRELRRIDLLRDLLLSDAGLDPAAVLDVVLPPILRHSRYAPAFKYLRGAGLINNAGELRRDATAVLDDRVREYVAQATARCLPPPSYQKAASRVLEDFAGYMQFAERRSSAAMLWYGCLVPREMVDLAELREFLNINWKYLDNTRMASQFLKLCCYYDMLVYRWRDSRPRRRSLSTVP